jgi:MarR family transcriptional regulator, organic hydroperoxide resistance regulator
MPDDHRGRMTADAASWRRSDESFAIARRVGPISRAILRVGRLHRILAGELLREAGLFPGQELVLMELWERDHLPQAEIIERLELDPATITKSLQRMERTGLVTRRPSAEDGRAVVVSLTRSGRSLRRKVEKIWTELERRTTDGMDAQARNHFLQALKETEQRLAARESRTRSDPRL